MTFLQLANDMGFTCGLPPIIIRSLRPPSKKLKDIIGSGRDIQYLRPLQANGQPMLREQIMASVQADADAGNLTYTNGEPVASGDVNMFAMYCDHVGCDPAKHRDLVDWVMS